MISNQFDTYLCVVDHSRLPPIKFVEKNVCVGAREHQCPRQIISRYEAVWLSILIRSLKYCECLLYVEVRILKEKLTLLFYNHFCIE